MKHKIFIKSGLVVEIQTFVGRTWTSEPRKNSFTKYQPSWELGMVFFYTKFTFFVTNCLQSLGIVSISNRIVLCSLAAYSTWMRKCQFHSFFLFHNFYLLLCVQLCWGEPQSFFFVWYFGNDSMSSLYNIYSLILIARVNSSAWFMELIYSIRFK